jgi:DNA helicase HerA-like ATPase
MVTKARPIIVIKPSDRVFFAGRTGSGKTTLAKRLLVTFPRFVILDPKHTLTIPHVPIVKTYDRGKERQIIRVPIDKSEKAAWEAAIEAVWRRGNTILYIDELTLITRARPILPALGKAIRTGRERGVGVWTGTQRPKEIPQEVFTEAEHIFTFQLTNVTDRLKVTHYTAEKLFRPLRHVRNHEFLYYNVLNDAAYRFPPLTGVG